MNVLILMPVYNDWEAAGKLCRNLGRELSRDEWHGRAEILLVDDGSVHGPPEGFLAGAAVSRVHLLRLRRNLGHQRAIAVALAFIYENIKTDAVVVMDADGEDRPEDVPRLLARFQETQGASVVFAARRKRLEGFVFRAGYMLYRYIHRMLTGLSVQVGNFSVIPEKFLAGLVVSPQLWAHYAATVVNARIPVCLVPTDRGARLAGRSSMNYVSLVAHGLGAMSVFRERVGTRLLIAASFLCGVLFASLITVVAIRLATDLAIPGWATLAAGVLAILLFHIVTSSFVFAFGILADRHDLGCLPLRDYKYYVGAYERIYDACSVHLRRD